MTRGGGSLWGYPRAVVPGVAGATSLVLDGNPAAFYAVDLELGQRVVIAR